MITFKELDSTLANKYWPHFEKYHYDFGTSREKLANNSRRYLAVEDGKAIGFVAIKVHYGKQTGERQCWYSHKIAVLPEYQSRWADVSDAIAEVVDASGKEYRCITLFSFASYRENDPRWKKVNDDTERNLSSWLYLGLNPSPEPAPEPAPEPVPEGGAHAKGVKVFFDEGALLMNESAEVQDVWRDAAMKIRMYAEAVK